MIFKCLVVKPYKGTSVKTQREIVVSLNGKVIFEGAYVWDVTVPDELSEIKRVEQLLTGKVPYIKHAN